MSGGYKFTKGGRGVHEYDELSELFVHGRRFPLDVLAKVIIEANRFFVYEESSC